MFSFDNFFANYHIIKSKETCAWFSNLLLAMIGLWKIEPDWVEEGLKGRFSDKGPAVWSLGSIGFKMGTAVSVECPAVMIEAVLFTWRLLSTNCSDQAAIPTFSFSFQFSVVFPRFLYFVRLRWVAISQKYDTKTHQKPWGRLGAGSFNSRLRTRISLLLERLLALDHKAIANNQLLGSRFLNLMLVISCNILWCWF